MNSAIYPAARWGFFFLGCLLSLFSNAQDYPADDELHLLLQVINEKHVHPREVDASFLQETFARFPDLEDPHHLFFTEQEILALQAIGTQTPSTPEKGLTSFLTAFKASYKRALARGNLLLTEAANSKIDWSVQEEFTSRPATWSKTEADLKQRWRLWIKYNILLSLRERRTRDTTAAPTLAFVQQFEKEEKEPIADHERRSIRRMAEPAGGLDDHLTSAYLKLIASQFDPHSVYFSSGEMESFMGSLQDEKLSYGLQLDEQENGDVWIAYLVPGGPAWKSGELHQKDVLIRLERNGQAAVNLEGIGIYELSKWLESDSNTPIRLTVRKSNGLLKTVALQREKIYADDNIVKGYVLKSDDKIGYISLPGFYSNWGAEGGSSCANDVAKEIIKLKKENIQGLILDLRSNGGGSLREAIDMAGIFIDEGPLLLLKDKTGKVTTLKDANRGILYDGPLILLVNAQSASASEMLAGTLQDYNRALIVGGRTYGKSTGQTISSLHPPVTAAKPGGQSRQTYATVTDYIIYRVSTTSYQGQGIEPDIKLPDLYDLPVVHEEGMEDVLTADPISKKVIYQQLAALPIEELRTQSLQRTQGDEYFKNISLLNKDLAKSIAETKKALALKWPDFVKANRTPTCCDGDSQSALFGASPVAKAASGMDTADQHYLEARIKEIEKDHYLAESLHLLHAIIKKK